MNEFSLLRIHILVKNQIVLLFVIDLFIILFHYSLGDI